ncbi:hypothetical protein Q0812_04320 [Brevundimonas sp. 2R-24]|uniref:Vgr related protein n=1 Tax=Peiella sedimenti TaxID=3061083 RepID=A0ABT8SLY6_9CAUL|nr:hypothetical protein [Caulobacteraceae bacterium XZ-24]
MRGLTRGERTLAADVFGGELLTGPVRILRAPWLKRAFVAGRWFGRDWIVWPTESVEADFSAAPIGKTAVFVHELVHVWQTQNGVNLLLSKLKAGDGPGAYRYPLDESCAWQALNIEQQAAMVEHAFRLSRGLPAPAAAAFYRARARFSCGL